MPNGRRTALLSSRYGRPHDFDESRAPLLGPKMKTNRTASASAPGLHSSVCLILAIIFATMSAAFGKAAALSLARFDAYSVATSPYYAMSLACVGMQALVWPFALRGYSLSHAYMTMSVVYLNLLMIAHFVFSESITWPNILGAALIAIGNVLIAAGRGS